MASHNPPHIVIFPFMAQGHTMPLIHLAHQIHKRNLATLTFITTPLNAPFLTKSLTGTDTAIITLPFPVHPDIHLPPDVENTEKLPSLAYFIPFLNRTRLLLPYFEETLEKLLPNVSFLISDGFLPWTVDSAKKFGVPRVVFTGMGNFAFTVKTILSKEDMDMDVVVDNGLEKCAVVPGLLDVKLKDEDFRRSLGKDGGRLGEFMKEVNEAVGRSYGMVVNSFYEMDGVYFDHWNENVGPKAWCVGPLCLTKEEGVRGPLMDWLDLKSVEEKPVLYVAFGTQADVSQAQFQEIAIGLENAKVDFLLIIRQKEVDLGEGFEERARNQGKIVREWVDQYEILKHPSIKGFISHCGWNSTLEGICSGVPFLAWPMMAEQHLNAKFIIEDLKVGLRVRSSNETKDGLVKGEDLTKLVKEFMDKLDVFTNNVKNLAEEARKAFGDGGSSWRMLKEMINEFSSVEKI